MTQIKGLKGFYDRYPEEWRSWRELIDTVEEAAREFGFKEIDTPSVERADLYRVKSGEELMDQMYSFEDKSGRELSLIPEQTPTRARMVQDRKDLKKPVKWFDTSKRWRYENVQRGRDREFFQTDFDIFGASTVEADAELIGCAARIFKKLELEERVKLRVSDRQIVEGFLEARGVPQIEDVVELIDDEEKMDEDQFLDELEELGLETQEIRQVQDIVSLRGDFREQLDRLREMAPEEIEERIERIGRLADQLEAMGVLSMCRLDLSIVRGLDYYTGLVFEAFDAEGELRALFGGGRYDDLVGMFGSQELLAAGFAFGYSTTVELLKKEGRWPLKDPGVDVYVLPVSESVRHRALEVASDLRSRGMSVETGISSRGFGKQLSYADSIKAERTLVVGERDLEKGVFTVKNMETGEEEKVPTGDLSEHLDSFQTN